MAIMGTLNGNYTLKKEDNLPWFEKVTKGTM
jgi:hypothetical protein